MWSVEFSEEVLGWYQGLSPEGKAAARLVFARVERFGSLLGMPLSKQMGGGVCELRFTCQGVPRRIAYTLDPDREAVTLITLCRRRRNERAQILRARRAEAASRAAQPEGKGKP